MRKTIRNQPRIVIEVTSWKKMKAITIYPDENETCEGVADIIKDVITKLGNEAKVKVSAREEVHIKWGGLQRKHLWYKTIIADSWVVVDAINNLPYSD